MMKTSELAGAQLDYWVAQAEGHSDAVIFDEECCHSFEDMAHLPYSPSSEWAKGGLLVEKYQMDIAKGNVLPNGHWNPVGYSARFAPCLDVPNEFDKAMLFHSVNWTRGDTPLQAVCRAVVRAKFGDSVEHHKDTRWDV